MTSRRVPRGKGGREYDKRFGPIMDNEIEYEDEYEAEARSLLSNKRAHINMQKQSLKHQEKQLDGLIHGVARVQNINSAIGEELDVQSDMMSDIEKGLETARDRTELLSKNTKKLIMKSGGLQWFLLICCLLLMIFLLLMILLS